MFQLAASGHLTPRDITTLMLSLALLVGLARLLGEWSRRHRLPMVLGELIAGLILGRSLLGWLSPDAFAVLFPSTGAAAIALDGLITVSAAMLLLSAGLEVDLSSVWRQGRAALAVSVAGVGVPFALGFVAAWSLPAMFGFDGGEAIRLPFALFVGIAVSITALPVIAKILMDLNMLKSDLGMLIMSAAMLNDLIGWMGFAMVLALLPHAGGEAPTAAGALRTVGITLVFSIGMLTIGRAIIHRVLPYIQAHWSYPGGVLGFVLVITLLSAAFTEAIGIHSIFGAFIAGVAIGDSQHLRERTRDTIHQFISSLFAPLFFATIGLYVSVMEDFDPLMTLLVLVIACVGKITGCFGAARLCGMQKRESWAVGFGMAAQGAMGIILGKLALNQGLIGAELFVAIVVMAMVTSLLSGPLIQRAVRLKVQRRLPDILSDRTIVLDMRASTVRDAIRELSRVAASNAGVDMQQVDDAVWRREQIAPTGLPGGLAVPHARLSNLSHSFIVLGTSEHGVDFDAADGRRAQIICLLLTPDNEPTQQLELLTMVAQAFESPSARRAVLEANNVTELLAALQVSFGNGQSHATPATS
jgi:Kef-type K+ transport system membrane component KefB/mannitol/fructose-specific phosphotransferase system IIA component (Ntr-type)